jgi:diketogulonate reductase-like aldo/keto reductase
MYVTVIPLLLLLPILTEACKTIQVYSELLGSLTFDLLPSAPESWFDETDTDNSKQEKSVYTSSGRQIYGSSNKNNLHKAHFMYHQMVNELTGEGRWIISTEFNARDHAVAWVESWAVTPVGVEILKDKKGSKKGWQVARRPLNAERRRKNAENYFTLDPSFAVMCKEDEGEDVFDKTVYFDSSPALQPGLSGFYVETAHPYMSEGMQKVPAVFAQIKSDQADPQLYMYLLGEDMWMIGETPGVDKGLAFVRGENARSPHLIKSHQWKFVGDSSRSSAWQWGDATVVTRNMTLSLVHGLLHEGLDSVNVGHEVQEMLSGDIHQALRAFRSLKYLPQPQSFASLRNGIPMPWVGLGTGGLFHEELKPVLKEALKLGYRLVDSAREYGNERLISEAVSEMAWENPDHSSFSRRDVFIATKVWPTQLGVAPTRKAVSDSLRELKTNYVDMYLLHWPRCDANIDWMHCHDTEIPDATWQQSWKALEREYAEGRVMSIGVSNFDRALLNEVNEISTINPHLVQNHAEPGPAGQDGEVRAWCSEHMAIYQPYAHQRNLQHLEGTIQEALEQISHMHRRSKHAIASKLFLQSGASVIPRSRNGAHLAENLDLFTWQLQAADMQELGYINVQDRNTFRTDL